VVEPIDKEVDKEVVVGRSPSSAVRAVGIAALVSVVLAAIVSWFAWPAREIEPRDVPVVVAGPTPAAAALARQLEATRPGAFKVTMVPDAVAADRALRDREAYAAFVLAEGVSLHTASAASPAVAQLLAQAAQQFGGGRPMTVVDVIPGSPKDPRGAGLTAGFLPLVLASMLAGILFSILIPSKAARFMGILLFAVVAGLVGAGVLSWLGLIAGGSYVVAAGVIALLALAVSATVTGLAALLGPAGIGLGVVVVFLFGNPISAVAAAPELLPKPWGAVGQFLPPGAAATLLRSAVFFNWAGSTARLWTLVGWAAVGLALLALGRRRSPGPAR
jgi:hypothetical protein